MEYGFIGLGNMARAILDGMAASGEFTADTISGYNRSEGKTLALRDKMGLLPRKSAAEIAKAADVIVLAVKPQMLPEVMEETAQHITAQKTVISIAAGKPASWYEQRLADAVPVVRVMPNINARVRASVSGICGGKNAAEEHLAAAEKIFKTIGSTYRIEEKLFAAFSAVGGASGAFVYLYIDALADAAVKAGFPRPFAVQIATDTVLGSAKLVRESGEHPIALANQVCSPGGTTIEGVLTLKKLGFETAVQQAVQAVIDKDAKLG